LLDKLEGFLEIKGSIAGAQGNVGIGLGVWLSSDISLRDTGDCALEALHASWVKEIYIDARGHARSPADVGGSGGSWRRTRRVGGRVDDVLLDIGEVRHGCGLELEFDDYILYSALEHRRGAANTCGGHPDYAAKPPGLFVSWVSNSFLSA
jgi:hypothetical protein